MFQHFYSLSLAEIRALTLPQFEDRLQDIGIILKMMNGEGRGRCSTSQPLLRAAAAKAGVRLPGKMGIE